jgi:hypothetical protein
LGFAAQLWFLYQMYLESIDESKNVNLNFFDWVHFFLMFAVRMMVVSTKYGFYSEEHFKIYKKVWLNY